jgi:rRNA processing protein Gar1
MARNVAGTVVDITPKGVLVRAPRMVPIGTNLVDVRNQPAGRVIDVLGPVSGPYLLVKPGKGDKAQRLLKQDLYTP